MKIHLEVSEAQREPNEVTGRPPIPLHQPTHVTVDAGEWVQLTYEFLRIGEHGDHLAIFDRETGFWKAIMDAPVISAALFDGTELDPATVLLGGMLFTDAVIAND